MKSPSRGIVAFLPSSLRHPWRSPRFLSPPCEGGVRGNTVELEERHWCKRLYSPLPPCGGGLGWGCSGLGHGSRACLLVTDPPPQPSPTRGEGVRTRDGRTYSSLFNSIGVTGGGLGATKYSVCEGYFWFRLTAPLSALRSDGKPIHDGRGVRSHPPWPPLHKGGKGRTSAAPILGRGRRGKETASAAPILGRGRRGKGRASAAPILGRGWRGKGRASAAPAFWRWRRGRGRAFAAPPFCRGRRWERTPILQRSHR